MDQLNLKIKLLLGNYYDLLQNKTAANAAVKHRGVRNYMNVVLMQKNESCITTKFSLYY